MKRCALETMPMLRCGRAVLVCATVLLTPMELRAEPLPKEVCDLLASEHDKLVAAGVKGWMAQGTQDARKRLGADKIGQIARFLEVDEQLLFRCGLYKARSVLPPDVEEPPAEQATPPAPATTPAVKPPPASREKAAPNTKPKSEPERKTSAQVAAPEPVEAAPASRQPAKKKAKPDDAFRPAAPARVD